ncbi:YgfZ/GcvT domain-containing protein [Rhodanobacter aciditrophus]|uniref:YgfZ/GcvT domain-containing protein n=2 Tax=Bacteria TaxID=2 RepID=A0ABW4AXB6_9GAMM
MQLEQLLNDHLPATSYAHAKDMGVIRVTGPDSAKFLQGQVTADIHKVDTQNSSFAAVCTPKGRIIGNFFVLQSAPETYLLAIKQDVLETLLTHLKKYAVFFKTELSDASDQFTVSSMFAFSGAVSPQEQYPLLIPTSHQDDCSQLILDNSFYRQTLTLAPKAEELPDPEDPAAHHVMGLLAARPLLTKKDTEELLPQWINMQRNGGISFTKGCYTGQEIVARMKYRGKSKKHLALFAAEQPIQVGSDVLNQEGKTIGQVFDAADAGEAHVAQVILNVDQSEFSEASSDGVPMTLLPLPYTLD